MKKILALAVAVMAVSGVASAQTYTDAEWYDMYQAGLVTWDDLPHTLRINVLALDSDTYGSKEFEPRLRTGATVDYDVNYSEFAVGTDRDYSLTSAPTSTKAVYIPVNERNEDMYGTKNTVKTARTDWTLDSDVIELYEMGLLEYEDLPHYLQMNVLEIDGEVDASFGRQQMTSTRRSSAVNTIVLKDVADRTFNFEAQTFREAERFRAEMSRLPRRHMSDSLMRFAPQTTSTTDSSESYMPTTGQTQVVRAQFVNRKSYTVSPDQYYNQMADVLRLRMKEDMNGGMYYAN